MPSAVCRRRIVGIVVDEHGFVRRDAIALEQDAEDPRIGLDHAFFAGNARRRRTRTGSRSARARAETSRPTSWSARSAARRRASDPRGCRRCLRSGPRSSRRSARPNASMRCALSGCLGEARRAPRRRCGRHPAARSTRPCTRWSRKSSIARSSPGKSLRYRWRGSQSRRTPPISNTTVRRRVCDRGHGRPSGIGTAVTFKRGADESVRARRFTITRRRSSTDFSTPSSALIAGSSCSIDSTPS